MTTAYNEENYAHAATFARRLLDLPSLVLDSNSELKAKVQATLEKCKQNENNKFFVYDYDDSKSFQLDAVILKPIYEGDPFIQCSYCSSVYYPESIGKLCVICCISSIGGNSNAEGLVLQRPGSSLGSRPSTTLDSSIRMYNDRPGTT
jgi:coatomer protein complex subunit alpha (xenin)